MTTLPWNRRGQRRRRTDEQKEQNTTEDFTLSGQELLTAKGNAGGIGWATAQRNLLAICWKWSDGKCLSIGWTLATGAQQEGAADPIDPRAVWRRLGPWAWTTVAAESVAQHTRDQEGARETRKAPSRSPSRGRKGWLTLERNQGLRRNEPGLLLKLRRTEEGEEPWTW